VGVESGDREAVIAVDRAVFPGEELKRAVDDDVPRELRRVGGLDIDLEVGALAGPVGVDHAQSSGTEVRREELGAVIPALSLQGSD
jgi:hypothetical protein